MNWKQVTSVYFSPTERTRKVVERIAAGVGGNQETIDLTDSGKRPHYSFTEDEVVVAGVPVYGGRVPAVAAERLRRLHGRQTAVVLVVTYGNRAYEDALLELKHILVEQGFRPVAAAAVVAEHNIVTSFGAGRPDVRDLDKMDRFAEKVRKILDKTFSNYSLPELTVKGKQPYRAYGTIPLKIKAGPGCKGCGLCIRKCPVQAISRTDAKVTDDQRCIACMRCVHVCPTGSRKIGTLMSFAVKQKLKKACETRKEPEFFL